ncbi:MAG: hypothetical protein DCF16_12945 [Alphaproteobacteria bacterium]|nr:MAG: hypothetical protein DCF16_12945 [Alphaproteobacteria bacterium]
MKRLTIPVKSVGSDDWGELSAFGPSVVHQVCGEVVNLANPNFSFAGGHRVRVYSFKKNVHWKIPGGTTFDIGDVKPADPPRRQGRTHHKS